MLMNCTAPTSRRIFLSDSKGLCGTVPQGVHAQRRTPPFPPIAWAISSAVAVLVSMIHGAAAHEVGLSRGMYAAAESQVTASIALSRREVANVVAIDANADGRLTVEEVAQAKPAIERAIVGRISVTSGGSACEGKLDAADLAEEDGLILRASYACSGPISAAQIRFDLIDDLAHGHRHIARSSSGAQVIETVLSRTQRTFDIKGDPRAPSAPKTNAETARRSGFLEGAMRAIWPFDAALILGLILLAAAPNDPRDRRSSRIRAAAWFVCAACAAFALIWIAGWKLQPAVVGAFSALAVAAAGIEMTLKGESQPQRGWTLSVGAAQGVALAAFPGLPTGAAFAVGTLAPLIAIAVGAGIWLDRRRIATPPRAVRIAGALSALIGVALFVMRIRRQ